jgi:hypothetical protein
MVTLIYPPPNLHSDSPGYCIWYQKTWDPSSYASELLLSGHTGGLMVGFQLLCKKMRFFGQISQTNGKKLVCRVSYKNNCLDIHNCIVTHIFSLDKGIIWKKYMGPFAWFQVLWSFLCWAPSTCEIILQNNESNMCELDDNKWINNFFADLSYCWVFLR